MKINACRFLIPVLLACTGLAHAQTTLRDTAPDTWVATDALGRSVPLQGENFAGAPVPAPRPQKFVGMFYFLWLGEEGRKGPFDNTEILKKDPDALQKPDSPLWGPPYAPHHWGKSAFGYYLSHDEWVLRRHAQMLSDAGVDTVIFDVTNQRTYPRSYLTLCKVWSQMRREGNRTPQIAFLTPFWAPSKVLKTLYEDFYQPGIAKDLWFQWQGKPLIMADPASLSAGDMDNAGRSPAELVQGTTQGQSFHAAKAFTAVGGSFPTWNTTTSGVTLSLYDRAGGKLLLSRTFQNVADNSLVRLEFAQPLAAGNYYLEQSKPVGQIGWWTRTGISPAEQSAYVDGGQTDGEREVSIRYVGDAVETALVRTVPNSPEQNQREVQEIRDFFTFRKPQPSYFEGPSGPNQWGWLEVTPQHVFKNAAGEKEQMTVGVAQNAVDGQLGVLSNPRAYGRSFHDGAEPVQGDFTGRNFAEQWQGALAADPQFLFVTSWNEWIAGRFGLQNNPFHGAGPVSFVDEFNAEFSRDIEPVEGAHGDDYYYQLVSNIRRFKGARAPGEAGPERTIQIDGQFAEWNDVKPEFRDDLFDTTPRDEQGWDPSVHYTNTSGRNDLDTLKMARDKDNFYAYARTRNPIVTSSSQTMNLYLDTDQSAVTGGTGFDFRVIPAIGKVGLMWLQVWKNDSWQRVAAVKMQMRGDQMEIQIPRRLIGMQGKPAALDFKWMDNVNAQSDALNLYRNGDTAPNGRFKYRYKEK